jgi:hypothetical protein
MARKRDDQEPLLSAVARKLGYAAGTLANLTHVLAKEQAAKQSNSGKPEPVKNNGPKSARPTGAKKKRRISSAKQTARSGTHTSSRRPGSGDTKARSRSGR